MNKAKFIIFGGNFNNKGAENMLYVTLHELKIRYPGAAVYVALSEGEANKPEAQNLNAELVRDGVVERAILAGRVTKRNIIAVLKACVKQFVKHTNMFAEIRKLKKLLDSNTYVLDISGYGLASNWPYSANMNYVNLISAATRRNAKVYLMPQSFGPFDYKNENKCIDDLLRKWLPRCEKIFAREKEGEDVLKQKYRLNNVVRSTDMVLQNSGIDESVIFKHKPELHYPIIKDEHNVAIVPNRKLLESGYVDEEDLVNALVKVVKKLQPSYHVYLLCHANEDRRICEQLIKKAGNSGITLVERELSCLEYSDFIEQMDFAVLARYHSLVNALRKGVPCIALGWADKYVELFSMVEQTDYMLDLRNGKSLDELSPCIEKIINRLSEEKRTIVGHLVSIQKENCFGLLKIENVE